MLRLPRPLSVNAPSSPASGRGLRYVAAGALFFSVMTLLVKLAGSRLPTMEIVLARSVVVSILAGATALLRRRDLRGREPRLLLLRGGLGFTALSCFYYAVVHLPLAEATVIQYTNPVFTALIAAAVLSESLRAREVALALASLAGVTLVARPGFLFGDTASPLPLLAVAVALAGALFSAGAYVTVRRLRREHTSVIVLWFAAVSTLGSLPPALLAWTRPTPREWVLLLGVGLSTHLGQVAVTRGLQRERAGRAMTVGYLQIVFAAVWGALILGELPGPWSIVGGLVIVVSTVVLGWTGRGVSRTPAPH